MARRLHYSGDVNIEHGGYFYDLSTFDLGYVSAVRVTPCTEAGDGAPDNVFWVETISINTGECDAIKHAYRGVGDTVDARRAHRALHADPNRPTLGKLIERIEHALDCCGWDHRLREWDKLTWAQKRHAVVEACVSYGYTDTETQWSVAIGYVTDEQAKRWAVNVRLRAGASLRRYAREKLK